MIAHTLSLLVVVAIAAAAVIESEDKSIYKHFHGVDPNSLSCDPEGQVFLLLPHFTDCNKYYMCAHGEEVEFTCSSEILFFDFELQTCNWQWASQCWLRDPIDEEGSGFDPEVDIIGIYGEEAENGRMDILTAESSGTVRPTSAKSAQQFNVILNCNRADGASQQVPYKGDCQRYWKCVEGVPQTAYCSDGLFFNRNTQQCDFEANAQCTLDQADELQGEFIVYDN